MLLLMHLATQPVAEEPGPSPWTDGVTYNDPDSTYDSPLLTYSDGRARGQRPDAAPERPEDDMPT